MDEQNPIADATAMAEGVLPMLDWMDESRVDGIAEYLVGWAVSNSDNLTEEEAQTEFPAILGRALIRAYMAGALDATEYIDTSTLNAEIVARLIRDGQVTISLNIT